MILPEKLKAGDQIRVISPALSLDIITRENRNLAEERLKSLGLNVTFSTHSAEINQFRSSTITSRVEDLHEAFSDANVKGILTTVGGYNSNQLLSYIDYSLIQRNPKVLCGFSDITALNNAIYAKTGLVTYSGPDFSSFGMLKGYEYTNECFRKCLMQTAEFAVEASTAWSDDEWYRCQENRTFIANTGPVVIQPGQAVGKIIGGNLCTLNLLQGTEYMPSIEGAIVFIEDDSETTPEIFDRDLQSLLHQLAFKGVKGLVIGRFQKASNITEQTLKAIIETKKELKEIPVVAGIDFGHTTPRITFPVGGTAELTSGANVRLKIIAH